MSFSSSSSFSMEERAGAGEHSIAAAEAAAGVEKGTGEDAESLGVVMKGKRTKRQRVHQLAPPGTTTASSTTSSTGYYTTSVEDEDMANCLILLAQGTRQMERAGGVINRGQIVAGNGGGRQKVNSRRVVGVVEEDSNLVYECKTCNKRFPSFQALGGHRTSHKKTKLMTIKSGVDQDFNLQISMSSSFQKPTPPPLSAPAPIIGNSNGNNTNKQRVHECSICGSEFSSGQALGGHMRRHRPVRIPPTTTTTTTTTTATSSAGPHHHHTHQDMTKQNLDQRNLLSLDLNLPAPSDEVGAGAEDLTTKTSTTSASSSTFPYATAATTTTGKPTLLFTPLVGCHY